MSFVYVYDVGMCSCELRVSFSCVCVSDVRMSGMIGCIPCDIMTSSVSAAACIAAICSGKMPMLQGLHSRALCAN